VNYAPVYRGGQQRNRLTVDDLPRNARSQCYRSTENGAQNFVEWLAAMGKAIAVYRNGPPGTTASNG
jgi:hypothetical protein